MINMIQKGTVNWFDPDKGYGFIEAETKEEDVFVHISDIEGRGSKDLEEGQEVEFEIEETDKGFQAVNVVKI